MGGFDLRIQVNSINSFVVEILPLISLRIYVVCVVGRVDVVYCPFRPIDHKTTATQTSPRQIPYDYFNLINKPI